MIAGADVAAVQRPSWGARALRVFSISLILVWTTLLTACGSDPVAVPDVRGIRLDQAHDMLAAKGFEDSQDKDHFGDRAIFIDSNWVVLEQDPKAGQAVLTDRTIVLRVGKIGEVRTKKALPPDSPVLAEMLAAEAAEKKRRDQEAADKAAEEAKRAAERTAAAAKYVNQIDPAVRLAIKNHRELATLRRQVADGDVVGAELTLNVSAAADALTALETILNASSPPDLANIDAEHEQLLAAVAGFKRAALTLMSADSAEKKSTLDRFDVVYRQARSDWNAALKSSYSKAGVANPPLIK